MVWLNITETNIKCGLLFSLCVSFAVNLFIQIQYNVCNDKRSPKHRILWSSGLRSLRMPKGSAFNSSAKCGSQLPEMFSRELECLTFCANFVLFFCVFFFSFVVVLTKEIMMWKGVGGFLFSLFNQARNWPIYLFGCKYPIFSRMYDSPNIR